MKNLFSAGEGGVGPSQLGMTARKTSRNKARIGGMSGFLMRKEGRWKGAHGESEETLHAEPDLAYYTPL
jgi:hypothetical protein